MTKHILSRYGSLLWVLWLAPLALQAQDDLPGEQVEVIANFEAQLLEVEKLPLTPSLPPADTTRPRLQYELTPRTLSIDYPPPRIRPLAFRGEPLPPVYNGFVRAGVGLPKSIYGEASYHVLAEKTADLLFRVKHHAADLSNDEVENQAFAQTQLGAKGTWYSEQGFGVKGHLDYDSDRVHFYGYNFDGSDTTGIPADEVRQVFKTFSAGASIFNATRNVGDINYDAGFDLYLLSDNYAARETGFLLNLDATKWIAETHPLHLGVQVDLTGYEDTTTQKLNTYTLNPSFAFHGDAFKVKGGLRLVSFEQEFSVYPDVEATVQLAGNKLMVFAAAQGDREKNTFRSLSEYNPFIASRFPALTLKTTDYLDFYGGIKGNLNIVEYSGKVGFKRANDLPLFLLDTTDTSIRRRFATVYDTARIFYLAGSLLARPFEGIEVGGAVRQNVYDLNAQAKPWHLPSLTLNSFVTYSGLEGALRVRSDLFVENGVPVPGTDGTPENLNGLFDLSLAVDYRFTDHISVWMQLNNLLNNKRQRWQYYPTYGLNFLLGASARF